MGALTFCSGNTPRDGNTPDRLGRCRSAADERVVLACCDVGLVGSDGIGAGGSRPIAPRRERKEPPRQRPPQSATEGGAFVILPQGQPPAASSLAANAAQPSVMSST
jgi:hypothetical protein